jgi:hypothetical protein
MRLILLLAAALAPLSVAAFEEKDWPCQQRRVPHLSIGQMWTEPLPADPAAWRADAELAALAPVIAARRTDLAEVERLVAGLADGPGGDRAARVALLYAGVFSLIDAERAKIVEAIGAFSRRLDALSAEIDAERARIAADRAAAKADDFDALDRIEAEEADLAWRTRIFQDRSRSIAYVCESPVLLEQRAFALARLMTEALAR